MILSCSGFSHLRPISVLGYGSFSTVFLTEFVDFNIISSKINGTTITTTKKTKIMIALKCVFNFDSYYMTDA